MKYWQFIIIIIIMVLSIIAVGETNDHINYLQAFSNIGTLLAACAAWYTASLNTDSLKQQEKNNKHNIDPFIIVEDKDRFEYHVEYIHSKGNNYLLNWETNNSDLSDDPSYHGITLSILNEGNGIAKNLKLTLSIRNIDKYINLIRENLNTRTLLLDKTKEEYVLLVARDDGGFTKFSPNQEKIHRKSCISNSINNNKMTFDIPPVYFAICNILFSELILIKKQIGGESIDNPILDINIESENTYGDLLNFKYGFKMTKINLGDIKQKKFELIFEII